MNSHRIREILTQAKADNPIRGMAMTETLISSALFVLTESQQQRIADHMEKQLTESREHELAARAAATRKIA
mgnify:CR=1 FL=1